MLIEGRDYRRAAGVDDNVFTREYILLRPHSYHSADLGVLVRVDAGYEWDGPTGYPMVADDDFRVMRASLFHDALYEPMGRVRVACDRPVTKRMADDLFHEIAKADGALWITRFLCWAGIKLGGRFFWEDRAFPKIGD